MLKFWLSHLLYFLNISIFRTVVEQISQIIKGFIFSFIIWKCNSVLVIDHFHYIQNTLKIVSHIIFFFNLLAKSNAIVKYIDIINIRLQLPQIIPLEYWILSRYHINKIKILNKRYFIFGLFIEIKDIDVFTIYKW